MQLHQREAQLPPETWIVTGVAAGFLQPGQRACGVSSLQRHLRPQQRGGADIGKSFQQRVYRGRSFIEQAQPGLAARERLRKIRARGRARAKVFQHRQRLRCAAAIEQRTGQRPLVLAPGAGGVFAGVAAHLFEIAQRLELLEQGAAVLLAHHRRQRRCRAVFPGRHAGGRLRLGKGVEQHLALHVGAHRQAVELQQRRRHIQQAGAVQQAITRKLRPSAGKDAVLTVPHGDAGGHLGDELGPQVVAVKTVVADQHHMRIWRRQRDQPRQHQVVHPVRGVHHLAVKLELPRRHAVNLRRVEGHEVVRQLVDGAEIHRREVPLGVFQRPAGRRLDREGFGQVHAQPVDTAVLGYIDLVPTWDELAHDVAIKIVRADPQRIQRVGVLLGPDRAARRGRPGLAWPGGGRGEGIRDHAATRDLPTVRRKPAQHMALETLRRQDVPDRAAAPRRRSDGLDAPAQRLDLGKTQHAVVVGALAGGDAHPEHRREHWVQRAQIAADTALDEPPQHRHLTAINQRMDNIPVSAVPTDEQDFRAIHQTLRPAVPRGGGAGPCHPAQGRPGTRCRARVPRWACPHCRR